MDSLLFNLIFLSISGCLILFPACNVAANLRDRENTGKGFKKSITYSLVWGLFLFFTDHMINLTLFTFSAIILYSIYYFSLNKEERDEAKDILSEKDIMDDVESKIINRDTDNVEKSDIYYVKQYLKNIVESYSDLNRFEELANRFYTIQEKTSEKGINILDPQLDKLDSKLNAFAEQETKILDKIGYLLDDSDLRYSTIGELVEILKYEFQKLYSILPNIDSSISLFESSYNTVINNMDRQIINNEFDDLHNYQSFAFMQEIENSINALENGLKDINLALDETYGANTKTAYNHA
jgi:hypothetical protein